MTVVFHCAGGKLVIRSGVQQAEAADSAVLKNIPTDRRRGGKACFHSYLATLACTWATAHGGHPSEAPER